MMFVGTLTRLSRRSTPSQVGSQVSASKQNPCEGNTRRNAGGLFQAGDEKARGAGTAQSSGTGSARLGVEDGCHKGSPPTELLRNWQGAAPTSPQESCDCFGDRDAQVEGATHVHEEGEPRIQTVAEFDQPGNTLGNARVRVGIKSEATIFHAAVGKEADWKERRFAPPSRCPRVI